MKRQLTITLGMLGLLLVSTLAPLQAQSPQFNVPFDFTVGNAILPAGQYQVSKHSSAQGVVVVRGENGIGNAFSLCTAVQSPRVSEVAKLIFHRYGSQYFLSQVWEQGTDSGRQVFMSKAEREIAKNTAKPKSEVLTARK